jgi:hypothetical protein
MTTRWITKKKKSGGNIHIPIRKTFGIPKEKAIIDVQTLREEGKRARLIETNWKRKLYAPYVTALNSIDDNSSETNNNESEEQKNKITNSNNSEQTISAEMTNALKNMNIIDKDGKLNISKAFYKEYFDESSNWGYPILIKVSSGMLEMEVIGNSRTTAIYEKFPTNLPDGNYTLRVNENKTVQLKKWENGEAPTGKKVDADFSNGVEVRLEEDDLKKFTRIVNDAKKHKAKISFKQDKDGKIIAYYIYNGDESEIKKEQKFNAVINKNNDNSLDVTFLPKFIKGTLEMMMGKDKVSHPENDKVLILNLKSRYPLEMTTRRLGDDDLHIEVEGIVAPRIGDD